MKLTTSKVDRQNILNNSLAVTEIERQTTIDGVYYDGKWTESKPTLERLATAVGNFAPELNRAVASQQETEAANAGTMAGLAF